MFEKYCDDAGATMRDIVSELPNATGLHPVLMSASQRYEALLQTHKASNRAMHEHFMKDLEVHELTKSIFRQSVEMRRLIQSRFLEQGTYTDKGAWSAAQSHHKDELQSNETTSKYLRPNNVSEA